MQKKLRPPVKIHGGKYYLSSWIIEHFPVGYEEMTYLEPFSGAASVFLNKNKSMEEAINDVNLGIIQIMRVLRDEPKDFIGRIKKVKYTERTFKRALKCSNNKEYKDYMDHATTEFMLRRMSRGGLKKAFAWSNRTRGGQPGDVNAWETIIKQLPLISERLKGVYIFNKNAFDVIKAFNDPNTLIYCDPPYLDSTRTVPNVYEEDELDADQHIELAGILKQFKGNVIISGYPSPLYRRLFSEWRCKRKKIACHASQSKTKSTKTECIWLNF